MRIRLTEAQAWETLARFFGGRKYLFGIAQGLCWQSAVLESHGWITRTVSERMYWTIQDACSKRGKWGFIWTRSRAGARARARFCWRQVKRLRGR